MKSKLQYCTLFNSAYLARGIALYESLQRVCEDFHLYIFSFDDKTFEYFSQEKLSNLTVISLQMFEDPDLLRIKSSRSAGEYCWTCTPSIILYCLERFELDHCTYIDADMVFYSNPAVLNEEAGAASVIITEHRYTPDYDQSATSGIYCVQYVLFRNDERGLKVLRWWRDACIAWCYNRLEDGKFGDQKYLDDWTTRFEGVHVLQHEGGGVAPWNLQQYHLTAEHDKFFVQGRSAVQPAEVVFFHFHGLRFYTPDIVEFSGAGYNIPSVWKHCLFSPYALSLFQIADQVIARHSGISNPNGMMVSQYTSHAAQGIQLLKANMANLLRFLIGRRKSFRKLGNHVYRRCEL
jgi:hypothetical protein